MKSSDCVPNARGQRSLAILFCVAAVSLVGVGVLRWLGWERASWGALSLFYVAWLLFFVMSAVALIKRRMRRSEYLMGLILAVAFVAIRIMWGVTYG